MPGNVNGMSQCQHHDKMFGPHADTKHDRAAGHPKLSKSSASSFQIADEVEHRIGREYADQQCQKKKINSPCADAVHAHLLAFV